MTEEERLQEQRQFYIQKLMDARSRERANLFMESALRKDINEMTPEELGSLKYYRDYLVFNPNSFPPNPASPLRTDWDERQSIIGATNDMRRQNFVLKNELDDVPSDAMVIAGERSMNPIPSMYPDMSVPEDIMQMEPNIPMGSPDTNVQEIPPSLRRSMDPVIDSDVFRIQRPLTEQIPNLATTGNPPYDFAMSPNSNINMGLSRTGDTRMPPQGMDFEQEMSVGSQVTPMVDRALSFSERMEKKLDPDATGDAFMLGGMLVNAHDKDRLMGDNSGSLAGVTKGGLKGAGLGYRVAGPEGALIGGAIGAGAGLLGAFDTTSPDPYTVETIQRGAGIAFPNMQSSNYYQGLI